MADQKTKLTFIIAFVPPLLWGFIGMYARNLSDEGFNSMEVSFTRLLIAGLILAVIMLIADRSAFRINKKDLWLFFLIGLFRVLSDAFLFQAQVMIHLSVSTVLQMTSPYWVLLLAVILFHEKFTVRKIFAISLAFVGCILVTGMLTSGNDLDLIGALYALIAGVAYGAYTIGNKIILDKGYRPDTSLMYIMICSAIICIPFINIGLADIPGKIVSLDVVGDLLGMGILMTLIPYYSIIYCLKTMSPVTTNVIGLLEVVTATLVGYWLYGETLGLLNYIGMILIPVSIVFMNVNVREKMKKRGF